mmetsp:Transcript_16269/g.48409  ORF Transcript_16269/g.48409 Transcript_16269/m.48409 type:complete len:249 (+) Transcript_16269:583-1329(+)
MQRIASFTASTSSSRRGRQRHRTMWSSIIAHEQSSIAPSVGSNASFASWYCAGAASAETIASAGTKAASAARIEACCVAPRRKKDGRAMASFSMACKAASSAIVFPPPYRLWNPSSEPSALSMISTMHASSAVSQRSGCSIACRASCTNASHMKLIWMLSSSADTVGLPLQPRYSARNAWNAASSAGAQPPKSVIGSEGADLMYVNSGKAIQIPSNIAFMSAMGRADRISDVSTALRLLRAARIVSSL